MTERKAMIKAKQSLAVTRQCQLLAVPRSSAYARLQDVPTEDLDLMRQLDELYLEQQRCELQLRAFRDEDEYTIVQRQVRLQAAESARETEPKVYNLHFEAFICFFAAGIASIYNYALFPQGHFRQGG